MDAKETEEIFQHLDRRCYSCDGTGQFPLGSGHDCSVCYGTGFQCTGAGVALLGFLKRQQKRIEKTKGALER